MKKLQNDRISSTSSYMYVHVQPCQNKNKAGEITQGHKSKPKWWFKTMKNRKFIAHIQNTNVHFKFL